MSLHLQCCVCGDDAGRWRQWWNRDTGYGICPGCIADAHARETAAEIRDLYGEPGIHYAPPPARPSPPATDPPTPPATPPPDDDAEARARLDDQRYEDNEAYQRARANGEDV